MNTSKNLILLVLLPLLAACHGQRASNASGTYIPDAPDYADPTFWYTRENDRTGQGADVLYFVSTWEADWATEEGRTCHYADVHNPEHRARMDREISRIAGYMGEGKTSTRPTTATPPSRRGRRRTRIPSAAASARPSRTYTRPSGPSCNGATPGAPSCWPGSARAARPWWRH